MYQLFASWVIFHAFFRLLILKNEMKQYQCETFSTNSFKIIIKVSNSLDPDQALSFLGPDLCPNCLQRLSADDTRR